MTFEAFPLQWPAGRPRIARHAREPARFDVTLARARDNVIHEVTLLAGGRWARDPEIVISSNLALRRDGLPLANQRQPEDPGVSVYFLHLTRQMSFACDRWERVEHNLQAIAKTIEALRGIARWGTGDMLQAAFTGFTALPAPSATREWWAVLGVPAGASLAVAQAAYRRLRSEHHPDRGGTAAAFGEVERAWRQAQERMS